MAHEDDRPTCRDLGQGRADGGLGRGVDALGRLVEQQERAVGQQSSGEGHAAALPGGQPGAALAEGGVERKVERGEPGGPRHGVRGSVRMGEHDVAAHRAGEQHRALRNPRDAAPPPGRLDPREAGTAHRHRPGVRPAQPGQQVEERGLAAAARPGDAEDLPR
ncbi:hypothetical protein GCM10009836_72450 [Pseudonocardia ailaonensis]|uniref:Uncharacterized protein n=1 Tax=Pseudonocardia ailaonensis TaxID=367279 RepID=A0ABN2NQ89_9PSEU